MKILTPLTSFKTCSNEPMIIKWNSNLPVIVEAKSKPEDEFLPIVKGSISGGEFSWFVRDPKYFNIPLEIKVINTGDLNDYDVISNVIVYQETEILSQTRSAVYCAGEDISLMVDADGYNLKFQWYRDDVLLDNQNKNILNLSNLNYENSAVYQCYVIGELDCNSIKSDPIAVYIATPTEIMKQPQHNGWAWGTHVKFTVDVHVNGNGEDKDIKFQWYDGYKPLSDKFSVYQFFKNKWRIKGTQSPILEFIYLLPDDQSDSIYCVVTGRCGSVKTRPAKLTEDAFFKYKILTPEITACVGTSAELKVQVTQTEPGTLIYEWYRTGERKIYDDKRISGASTPTLTIKSCIESDLGSYVLRITHKESGFTLNSLIISLYAESDPNLITKIKDYTVYDRRNSPYYYGKIHLIIGSFLMMDKYYFEWYKNDTLFLKGKGLKGAEITIDFPTLSDEGKYYCVITGGCGVTYTDTFNIFMGYSDIVTCQGSDTIISVRKHKSDMGQMKYYWMFRNSKIQDVGRYEGSTTCNLTVKSVTISQEGEYTSYAIDTILNKTYKNGFVNLDNGIAPKITKIYFKSPIYMKAGLTAKKMLSIVTKKIMKIELYQDDLLYNDKSFSPKNWLENEITLYIGCNTGGQNCMAGVLPSGKYKFRLINDCGETWSNEFIVKNLDSTTGIVYNPNEQDNTDMTSINFEQSDTLVSTYEDMSPELQTFPVTGIDNNYNDEYINIFPNPAKDYIYIQPSEGFDSSESYDIRIFDMLGVIQSTPSIRATPQRGELQIDVSFLAPGIYFIKIGNRIEKFVKI
jgi:hypothetical protein